MAYPDYIDAHEKRIITKILRKALKVGYSVSVFDGEETALTKSTDFETITKEIAATDGTWLSFHLSGGDKNGTIMLVHGNGEDVVADYTDNEAMRFLVGEVD